MVICKAPSIGASGAISGLNIVCTTLPVSSPDKGRGLPNPISILRKWGGL
ncbi:hypothetical protein Sjap_018327 [Stephania japonica]|uniref:Uncharacterized protein n=1 Tax=Stephania japonica TaxID=461633 RepID=A0AAP0I7S7_9MAGN